MTAPTWLFPLDSIGLSRGNDRRALEAHLAEIGVQAGDVGIAHVQHEPGCAFERGLDCDCSPTISSGPPLNRAARRRAARGRRR